MRKILHAFVLLCVLGWGVVTSGPGALADEDVVRVGVYQNPPQVFIDDQGKPGGIYVDILSEVARLEGWTLEFVETTFSEGLKAVTDGKLDVLTSIAGTPARDEFVDFSKETVISVWGQVYVSEGFSPKNIFDMDGRKIAVMKSGLLGKRFAELCKNFEVNCEIVPVESYEDTFLAIDSGKADAAVVNSIFGFSHEDEGAYKKLVRSQIVFSPFRLQVAVPEGQSKAFVAALDRHLANWRGDKNSFYFQTIDRWLGVKPGSTKEIPVWVWVVIGVGAVSIALIFVWNATLRKQIERRRKMEAALKISEGKYRDLIENTSVVAWELDISSFLFTYVSPHAEKLLGYPIEQWKSEGFWANHIALEDRDAAVGFCMRETEDGRDHDFEYRMIKADGSLIWLRDIVTVHKDRFGNPVSLSGFLVNISELKEAEAQLQETKYQAEEANRAKSEFLASMSHDLRTPLNAIMGFSDMMRQNAFGPMGNRHYEEYANDIHESGALLLSLIDDVLDLSKVEAGKYDLIEGPIQLPNLVGSSINMVSTLASIKSIAVSSEVEAELPALKADEKSLTQILNNLLSNAVKFTPNGGSITISAGLETDRGIAIRVKDNGMGMSKEDIAKALNPFEQADSLHSRHHEGTGLGLHICKKFLELHGGEIRIESVLAKGTCVTATFPPERTL